MHLSVSKFAVTLVGALTTLLVVLLHGCGRGGGGCDGPALNVAQLQGLRRSVQAAAGSPRGALVLPNPIDATNSTQVMATDSRLSSFASAAGLPGLISPQ